ncbi:MAG: hypothetical protein FJZ56_03675 [Chlamydiae bacterium]|nr:hypothetical protein [Chlamydiota bacterium]
MKKFLFSVVLSSVVCLNCFAKTSPADKERLKIELDELAFKIESLNEHELLLVTPPSNGLEEMTKAYRLKDTLDRLAEKIESSSDPDNFIDYLIDQLKKIGIGAIFFRSEDYHRRSHENLNTKQQLAYCFCSLMSASDPLHQTARKLLEKPSSDQKNG